MNFPMAAMQTGGETSVSPGWLVIFGCLMVILGVVGVSWSVAGRPISRRGARVGNGVSAALIGLGGVAMLVIGLARLL